MSAAAGAAAAAETRSLPSPEALGKACDGADTELLQALFQRVVLYAATATEENDTAAVDLLSKMVTMTTMTTSVSNILVDVLWFHTTTRTAVSSPSSAAAAAAAASKSHLSPALLALVAKAGALSPAIPTTGSSVWRSLDWSVLQQAGLLVNSSNNDDAAVAVEQKKMRQFNTAAHYKQPKYNLMAEESQGYSKLLRVFTASAADGCWKEPIAVDDKNNDYDTDKTTTATTAVIMDLIGTFGLDPVRCLDLLVDWMEHEYFLTATAAAATTASTTTTTAAGEPPVQLLNIVRQLPVDKLPPLLGFKLAGRGDPTSVLRCMTWLVRGQVLVLSQVWPYLPAWTNVLQATHQEHQQYAQQAVQAMGRTRLGGSSTSAATATDAAVLDLKPLQNSLGVQWLYLFLEANMWPTVQAAVPTRDWSALCVLFPESIGGAILDWVQDVLVAPLYQKLVPPVPWATSDTTDTDMEQEGTLSLTDFVSQIAPPLALTLESGAIQRRPILFSEICRLVAVLLRQDSTDNKNACKDFVQTFLLPSLGQFTPNPALSMEVWAILEQLSYTVRYSLYRSWRGSGLERAALKSNKPLWLVAGELQAGKDVRYALKRLSKDTIRDASRSVAKVCHSYPLVVFTTILNQIESYDNLVQVMVDCLQFVTSLSLDVLGFCVLSRLSGSMGGVNRSRLKEDGVNVSQWLQSLESFTGAFYKRFPFIEMRGILSYLMRRLKDGHVMELGVLRTLLKTSGGWAFADYAPVASMSATQLEGRAGSTLLSRETISFGVFQDFNIRASNEIRKVLQGDDDMGVSLLILLAQVRHQIVFESTPGPPKPVKLIGNLVDTCQVVMAILLDFLADNADESQKTSSLIRFAKCMPSLAELQSVYGLDIASAWMLCRPLIRAASTRLNMDANQNDGEIMDDAEDALSIFKPTTASRMMYQEMLPGPTWEHISTSLFELFFANSIYDLSCPEEIYTAEIGRLNKEVERLSRTKAPPPTNVQPGAAPTMTDEEELVRVKRAVVTLSSDLLKQKEHVASIRKSFKAQKTELFVTNVVSPATAMTFLSRCIYPRCMQGPDDALYCVRFILILHEMKTPGFGTLQLLDSMIIVLSRALFGLTEGEAANVSILLFETWKLVSKWRYDEKAFQKEMAGTPGSFMVLEEGEQQDPVSVSYEAFEALYNKWHAAIGAAVLGCLKSSEYMHTRNCLIVLTRMVEVYPTRPALGTRFIRALGPLQDESYTLNDIRASAQAYGMQLIRARDDGAWKEEDAVDVKARADKEQATAAARQKKALAQMAEMKRDSDKITDEIGLDGKGGGRGGDRGSGDRRRPPAAESRDQQQQASATSDAVRRGGGPVSIGGKTFEPANSNRDTAVRGKDDRRVGGGGGGGPLPPRDAGRDREDRWPPRGGPGGGGRGEGGGGGGPSSSQRGGLDGRWERSGDRAEAPSRGDSRGSKRSRDTSPVRGNLDGGGGDHESSSQPLRKRTRVEPSGAGTGKTTGAVNSNSNSNSNAADEGKRNDDGGGGGRRGQTRRRAARR